MFIFFYFWNTLMVIVICKSVEFLLSTPVHPSSAPPCRSGACWIPLNTSSSNTFCVWFLFPMVLGLDLSNLASFTSVHYIRSLLMVITCQFEHHYAPKQCIMNIIVMIFISINVVPHTWKLFGYKNKHAFFFKIKDHWASGARMDIAGPLDPTKQGTRPGPILCHVIWTPRVEKTH